MVSPFFCRAFLAFVLPCGLGLALPAKRPWGEQQHVEPLYIEARAESSTTISASVSRTSTSLPVTASALPCNGHAALCSRSYGNITFIGAHDSFAWSTDPLALARDQEVSVAGQLGLGVRLLQAQAHLKDGQLHFCHTDCRLFDGGTVLSYLQTVRTFMDANPREVLTLLFTNPEKASINGTGLNTWQGVFSRAGLTQMIYVPPSTAPVPRTEWPSLGTLIASGKRLVVFLDTGANPSLVPGLLPEFQMIWETPFSQTNSSFPCRVDRTSGPLFPSDQMYLINHNLNVDILPIVPGDIIISDPFQASTTNGAPSIFANIVGCASSAPRSGDQPIAPNFLLLDFVGRGEAFAVADWLNGVGPIPSSLLPPPKNSTQHANMSMRKLRVPVLEMSVLVVLFVLLGP